MTAFGTEVAGSDTYQVIPNVFISSSYVYCAISVEKYSRPLKEDGVDSTPGGNI